MMICITSGGIFDNSNNSQRFGVLRGKNKRKKAYLSRRSIPIKAGTPKNRVWRHTRVNVFKNHAVEHTGVIIPVGTTVSVHGFRPSPFSIVTVYCSRYPTQCQGKGAFVYNSFTNFIQTRKKTVHPKGWTAWSGGEAHAFFVRDKAGKRATMA